MTKHLRLLETLRKSSTGLKEITEVVDQAIIDIEKIEDPETGNDKESAAIMLSLGDEIAKIQKNRQPREEG